MKQGTLRLAVQLRDFLLHRPLPKAAPFRLWVDITSRCNLKCPACPQRMLAKEERRDMPEDLLGSLADQVAAGAAREVNLFHRGEPLLHPRIGFWIQRFKDAGALLRLHTNATILDRERVEAILEAGPHILTASIDTLDPAAYASSRPGADLERTLSGLELLLTQRQRRGVTLPRIALLLMGRQAGGREVKVRLKRLKSLGLDRVVWRAPHNWGGALGPAAKGKLHACTFPWYGLAVLSDGKVTPCPQDFFGEIGLGDASEQPLMDIWHSANTQKLRKAHAALDLAGFPVCLACDRVRRPFILGLPLEHLHNFLAESIFGWAGPLGPKPWKK
jgi:radical SAM protein with 4Fe4S-binding SPASM domain